MQVDPPKREDERRQRPRRDVEPIHWRDIARRSDRESLPFLRYFDELERQQNPEAQPR